MTRLAFPVTALAITIMACSLGTTQSTEETAPTESGSTGGGVPISKATANPTEVDRSPTEGGIQPTLVQQPTQAQTPVPVGPGGGELPVVVTDLNVTGTEQYPTLIGLVQNVGNVSFSDVYLYLTFHDANGNVVDTRTGALIMNILAPGEISPFDVFFPSGVPADVNAVGVSIELVEASPENPWTSEGFEVVGAVGRMGQFNYEISGVLLNNSGANASTVILVPIAYNADGRLIGFSIKVLDDIAAGSQTSLNLEIAGGDHLAEPVIDHFEILINALLER